jgi:hypothetical protein
VAEWLGRGLQSLAHQFDSGRRLVFFAGLLLVGLVSSESRDLIGLEAE